MKYIDRFDKVPYVLISLWCTVLFSSCGDDDFVRPLKSDPELTVSVVANEPLTKDIITAGFLDDNSEIGVAFYNADEGAQIGVNYNYPNTKFTAAGVAEDQVWNPEQPIYLGETVGTAYAYYPYNSAVTNVEEIPVTTVGQTDYLYAKQENLSNTSTNATFPMNHGLAVVSLKVVRGSYPGAGLLSKAEVRGPGICTAGQLNAKTGALHSYVGKAEPVAVNTDLTINEEGDNVDVIVVPNGETGAFRITLTIDGVEYITNTTEIKLESGYRYHYTVTANDRQVVLSAVTIGDWGYNDAGDPTILVGGYSITLAGDLTGLAFNSVVRGSTVTIEARPKTAFWVPVSITASEGVTMTQQVASDGLITLNLSEITANIVVTFVGYKVGVTAPLDNLLFQAKILESEITLSIKPKGQLWLSQSISLEGSAIMDQVVETDGTIVLRISEVAGDINLTLSGYLIKYEGYFDAILTEENISENIITIRALNKDGHFIKEVNFNGTADFSQTSDGMDRVLTISNVATDIVITFDGIIEIPEIANQSWGELSTGVYLVRPDLKPAKYVYGFEGNQFCIGVGLVYTTYNQCFMIAKYEEQNNSYITIGNLYGLTNKFYWGSYKLDNEDIPDVEPVSAKTDFNGKVYSEILKTIKTYGDGSYSQTRTIGTALNYFIDDDNDNCGLKSWYIPSAGQLYLICSNLYTINQALNEIGGTPLSSSGGEQTYWSSNEYGYWYGLTVNMYDGSIKYEDKNNSYHLRLIIDL